MREIILDEFNEYHSFLKNVRDNYYLNSDRSEEFYIKVSGYMSQAPIVPTVPLERRTQAFIPRSLIDINDIYREYKLLIGSFGKITEAQDIQRFKPEVENLINKLEKTRNLIKNI